MKNLIGLIILIALAIAVYFMVYHEPTKNTADFNDFAIEDTASVDKIFISEPNGKNITLQKNESGTWMVNNEFPARKDPIALILKTLHDIKIRGPVSEQMFESIVTRLAAHSKKIEFYTGGKTPAKTWYVGEPSSSRMGTYMLLEKDNQKSSKPYITHLLMEKGSLNSRFFASTSLWKDPVMMQADPKKIRSITVTHDYDTATSFKITKENNRFFIENLKTSKKESLPAKVGVDYFTRFKKVYYEYIDEKTKASIIDSIYNSIPRHAINVQTEEGKTIVIKTFHMPVKKGATLGGKPLSYHPERMYALSSEVEGGITTVVQNYAFDPLVPTFENFTSSTTVEK